jgi:hypothetical protein
LVAELHDNIWPSEGPAGGYHPVPAPKPKALEATRLIITTHASIFFMISSPLSVQEPVLRQLNYAHIRLERTRLAALPLHQSRSARAVANKPECLMASWRS